MTFVYTSKNRLSIFNHDYLCTNLEEIAHLNRRVPYLLQYQFVTAIYRATTVRGVELCYRERINNDLQFIPAVPADIYYTGHRKYYLPTTTSSFLTEGY